MRIAICGSVLFAGKMKVIGNELKQAGHEYALPASIIEHNLNRYDDAVNLKNRSDYMDSIKPYFTRKHFDEIVNSDAILVVNEEKNGIPNYIGGATFAEIMLAFHYNKKMFFLNPLPSDERLKPYLEEIRAVKPVVINGNMDMVK